jgi:hypothetical protein
MPTCRRPRRIDNRQRDQRIVREKQQARRSTSRRSRRRSRRRPRPTPTAQPPAPLARLQLPAAVLLAPAADVASWGWQSYNYYNDPYYYTANDYRYYRGGSWYGINRYGADILRQAINYGYQEGLYAGRADRMDGWRFDYRNAWVYRDANYGYRGFYVQQREYNYYFREGFRRGYEDGYYTRYNYGRPTTVRT